MKNRNTITICTTILLACFGFLPGAQPVVPAPDGGYPGGNTAEGQAALLSLTTGTNNTAVGWFSLKTVATGQYNTAIGAGALSVNTANLNTATGGGALWTNSNGDSNTANGFAALFSNTEGRLNTATGSQALFRNTAGDFNTALGYAAGALQTTGCCNVYIGASVVGVAGESNTTRIRNIYPSMANGRAVYVNSDYKIGTLASSRRFKEGIKPMDKASEVLFALKPVSFRYKKEADAGRAPMFGLIAEDVEQVDPGLVSHNEKGEVETVRYEQINAMLLNEFLKEHKTVQEQGATIARLQKQIEALTAGLQKVSDQLAAASPYDGGLEVGKFATGRIRRGGPAPRVVNNP